tara:strand:- start:2934 stop:3374 length:441 start_codon:yes stop_codon:yes gene_type:complete
MALLDKINPLKKKKEAFPHFDEKLGPASSGVPGPSFEDMSEPKGDEFAPLPSAGPSPTTHSASDEKIEAIQRTVELIASKLDSIKANIDSLSQRIGAIETKLGGQPKPQPQPIPQPTFQQPTQTQPQSYPAPQETQESRDDSGWHF